MSGWGPTQNGDPHPSEGYEDFTRQDDDASSALIKSATDTVLLRGYEPRFEVWISHDVDLCVCMNCMRQEGPSLKGRGCLKLRPKSNPKLIVKEHLLEKHGAVLLRDHPLFASEVVTAIPDGASDEDKGLIVISDLYKDFQNKGKHLLDVITPDATEEEKLDRIYHITMEVGAENN